MIKHSKIEKDNRQNVALQQIYHNKILQDNLEYDEKQSLLLSAMQPYIDSLSKVSWIRSVIKKLSFTKKRTLLNKCGIYIWGDVGSGKSMSMQIFYDAFNSKHKYYSHFHQFMLSIHQKLNSDNQNTDSLRTVAKEYSKYKLICLDELVIKNIADAMIVMRLFAYLEEYGVFLIITSNFSPDNLYLNGLQRERFHDCIEFIQKRMLIYKLGNGFDYRLSKLRSLNTHYFFPINSETSGYVNDLYQQTINYRAHEEKLITTQDKRQINVLRCNGYVAFFHFEELCAVPMGASDYIALAEQFRVFFILGVPQFHRENHSEALRFITLVDCLYERSSCLICQAQCSIEDLNQDPQLKFEFKRTQSRLQEMQSQDYGVTDDAAV